MSKPTFSFDTALYDKLPISCMVYEPVLLEDGSLQDFRLLYGNRIFLKDWETIYPGKDWHGALLMESTLMDEYSLHMMDRFRTEKPFAFSTYMPLVNLHLHFEPMTDLQPPYYGFFITNLTDYEEREAKVHFLRNIRQMQNVAVLMRIHDYSRLETVYVSDGFARMMECSVKEAVSLVDGSGFINVTHPEDRPLVRSMLKRHTSDDGDTLLTIQLNTARGNPIWASVNFAFIDDFREHYVYCTYFDVTTLKMYEERLRSVYLNMSNSNSQLDERTLGLFRVNLSRDLIEDVKGTDIYDCDSVGRAFSEALRERAEHFPISAEREEFLRTFGNRKMMGAYDRGRTAFSQMLYSRRSNGSCCFVLYAVSVTRHPMTGDIIAFISERECNDEKVSSTLQHQILARQFDMVAFLSEGRYGVVIGDAANILKGSIFPVSRNGEFRSYLESQVFPVLAGEPDRVAEMAHALLPETVEEQLQIASPYVVNISVEVDGEIYHKRLDFYSVDPEAHFYVLLKSDTTAAQREQMLRNEQLRDALREAEQANVAKTAFLSSMSHEIRTPMNAIIGLDTIALKDPDLPDRTREQLEKIGGSARHLLGLINDILDMSRIESGRMTLKNEEFSFSSVLEQINTMINSQCQDKGLNYHCDIHGHVDEYYIGDDMKLKQVLINILGNAVKFTNAGGTVSLQVERTAQFEDQSSLRFIISDTGIGMDQEYLPTIFDAFSQEDATTTNKYGGSGLGMAITKNIVEMMNGTITVESEKGVGSTFTVTVTLRNSDRSSSDRESLLSPQDMKVLIIDDDEVACEHAKLVLEEIGVSSDYSLSGKEALEMIQLHHARRDPYNLILVDLKMPEQDGVEVTRAIRETTGDESAVIMLTAYDWADIAEEASGAGVDSFLRKPLFASVILDEFGKAIAKKGRSTDQEGKTLADLSGRHILLAEDMFINAEIMKELLSMREMEAEHAENGRQAVEMFQASAPGHFDAILMDVRMPVLDGLSATETIRALDRSDAKTVPIIAMTANAFDEDVQRSLQAGMSAHLSKPVEPDRLYQTLAELIGANESAKGRIANG